MHRRRTNASVATTMLTQSGSATTASAGLSAWSLRTSPDTTVADSRAAVRAVGRTTNFESNNLT